jgi:hypothetical protein
MQTVYKLEVLERGGGGGQPDTFRASEAAELPPRLRAMVEENKVRQQLMACFGSMEVAPATHHQAARTQMASRS